MVPEFLILHVLVNSVLGGMDSPLPMVTSSTSAISGSCEFE